MIRESLLAAAAVSSAFAQRAVYPLSMVPGGVYSASEWKEFRTRPVYRQITGIPDGAAHPAELRKEIRRFVSFQKHGNVRWTNHLLTIGARESVLAIDGKIAVRSRCGNVLSILPPPVGQMSPETPPDVPETPKTASLTEALLPPSLIKPMMPVPDRSETTDRLSPVLIPPVAPVPVPALPVFPSAPVVPSVFLPGPVVYGHAYGAGAAEIVATAPEPKTWVAAILGLIGIGLIMKFRRVQ